MFVENVTVPDMTAEEHLEKLVNAWHLPLLRTCCALLGDADLARDAVQETFVKAYQALPSFRGESSEKTWLMRIAMNVCHDMRRGSWFRIMDRRVSLEDLPEPSYSPRDEESAMMSAILSLPEKDRRIILLYYYHNMTLQEIADTFGISQPAVSKGLKRAQARLQAMLKEED